MLTNFFNFIGDNITYTAAIVSGVTLFNFSFYCLLTKSIPLGFNTLFFGSDILSPINTSSYLSSGSSSLLSGSSSLSSGSTAMQLTPTVSSSSTPSYLSSQFQFHYYLRTQLIGS